MIRNVVLGKLRDDIDDAGRESVDVGLSGIAALELPGLQGMQIGRDLGLREGGWSFAITNDWSDADAYRNYDQDAVHNRYRAMLTEQCAQLARVQFEI